MRYLIIILSLFLITCGGGGSAPTDSGEENTDNANPSMTVTGIDNNTSVNGQVSINVSATDNVGILKVEFYVNNQLVSTITSVPYVYNWDTTTIIDGIYPLKIKVYDTSLNTSEQIFLVSVDNNFNGNFERVLKVSTEGSDAIGYSIIEDDGGYTFVGHGSANIETSNTANDVLIIKLDVRGNIISQNKSDIGAYDFPRDFIKADDGGYVVVGGTYPSGFTSSGSIVDAFMLKTDSEGIEEWHQVHSSDTHNDQALTIHKLDGGYLIGGYYSGQYDTAMLVTDLSGGIVSDWNPDYTHAIRTGYGNHSILMTHITAYDTNKKYNFSPMMQQTNDGGYVFMGYILGRESEGEPEHYLFKIVKLASDGRTLEWHNTYWIDSSNWYGTTGLQTSGDRYVLAGRNAGGTIAFLITDNSGNQLVFTTYGYQGNINSIYETNDGGFILAGYTDSTSDGNSDVLLIKTDSQGNELWSKTYGGEYDDSAMNVKQTSDGGYIVVGYYSEGGGGSPIANFYILRTDYNGNIE